MIVKQLLVLALMGVVFYCSNVRPSYALSDKAKITIIVVDEDGVAVKNAHVGVGFETNTREKETSVRGVTNVNGRFVASESCNSSIGFRVTKDGYYKSVGHYLFEKKNFYGWEPWNPEIIVVLRKIENPVPMYARDTMQSKIEIPVVGKAVGFDLIAFDWIAPYGKGSHADFEFKLDRRVADRKDFDATLTVTFPNKFDGIHSYREDRSRGSLFKLPRFAPEDGYQNSLVLREWRKPQDYNVNRNFDFIKEDNNYFFRVRSEEKDGQLVRSMHGKILGPIDFTVIFSKTAKIYFKYFLNPDYTRNLEFDPKRNLFGSLPPLEQVGIQ